MAFSHFHQKKSRIGENSILMPKSGITIYNPVIKKPLLIYDGKCPFCCWCVEKIRRILADQIDFEPYQTADDRYPEIPTEYFQKSVQLIEINGKVYYGAEAVFRAWAYAPRRGWLLVLYKKVPLFARISEWGYRFTARHRRGAFRIAQFLFGD